MEAGFGQSAIFPLGRKQLNQSSDTVQVGKLRPFPPSARRLPALSHHHNHHHHHQVAGTRPTRRRRQLDSDQSTLLGPGTGAAESGRSRRTAESGFPPCQDLPGAGPVWRPGAAGGAQTCAAETLAPERTVRAAGPAAQVSSAAQVSGRRHCRCRQRPAARLARLRQKIRPI